jgi:hypothetical protein
MRIWSTIPLFLLAIMASSCGESKTATPVETLKTYTKAIAKKDTAAMKVLLSDATIKMHERQAAAQGVSVDEIIQRETLFAQNQRSVEFKNEKIDGDSAALMVKSPYGSWETVIFVREDGVWKIDKAGSANKMVKDIEDQQNKTFEDLTNINTDQQVSP